MNRLATAGFASLLLTFVADRPCAQDAIDVGSRRELFVDDYLLEKLAGDARRTLYHPTPKELALTHEEPWEGTGSGYHTVFQDRDAGGVLYRMYYKASHLEVLKDRVDAGRHPLYLCYAESRDGVRWRKPKLGLHEFEGSKDNNIVLASGGLGRLRIDAGHPAVFKDENPDAPPGARYKAIVRASPPEGLLPLESPDGLRFSPMTDAPILAGRGTFDSQNLAFWDPTLGKYRMYWRFFDGPRRAIRTATSEDLIHWSDHSDLTYVDSPSVQLYTNQVKPYSRAPHILLGFPTRYIDRGSFDSMKALPELEHRRLRSGANPRLGTALTEAMLMASRDGVEFKRWNEAFLRPGVERRGTWLYGQAYIAWHAVETASAFDGAPNELSLYASESYWTGKGSALRRYTLRLDGFVSISAPASGGELRMKPIVFEGERLYVNFATSAAGSLRVEIQDADGTPIEGYSLSDCPPIFGNSIDRVVTWKGGPDVGRLTGRPVRLWWTLEDADLFSFRFGRGKAE